MSILTKETPTHGKSKYIQGSYYSLKNECSFIYRSSYELAYLYQLEKNPDVVKYIYEPLELYYIDNYKKQRTYKPDFMILYGDGKMEITEVKPTAMLGDFNVRAKAKAAELYIKDNFKDSDVSYRFITEKDLFTSDKEYADFLKSLK